MHTTTVRSWPLLGLSVLLATATLYFVVLDDVRHGSPVTAEHVLYCLVFVATLVVGFQVVPAMTRLRTVPMGLALAAVYAAGTFFIVSESAGRASKASFHRETEATVVDGARQDAVDELKKARAARAELTARFNSECGSGLGSKCKGLKEALGFADTQVYKAEARLDGAKLSDPANGAAHYMGRALAFLGLGEAKRVEEGYALLSPLGRTLTLDFAILLLLHLSFGHSKREKSVLAVPTPPDETKKLPAPKQEILVVDPVVEALRKAGRPLTNDELAEQLGVVKGTASKAVTARPDLLVKQRRGRNVYISLAKH